MAPEVKTMTQDQIETFLKSQKVGLLALSDTQSAYAIPVGYSYNGKDIYITMQNQGRKMAYINSCRNVCFTVYWLPENFGIQTVMSYKSVICDGVLEQITDPEGITKAVRGAEKHLGLPEGKMTLQDTANSGFWKINVRQIGSQLVEDFREGV